jgi:hypothetical protein
MSLFRNAVFTASWRAVALAAVSLCLAGPSWAVDLVVLRDGSEFEGKLVSVDRSRAVLEFSDGSRETFERAELARIEFGEEELPDLFARVLVQDSDDVLRLFLNGEEVAAPADLEGRWFDLAPLLIEGANLLTAEVENQAGTWSYRWLVQAGKDRASMTCGLRGKSGCTRLGGNGREQGTMPAGKVWIYVERSAGEAVIEVEEP